MDACTRFQMNVLQAEERRRIRRMRKAYSDDAIRKLTVIGAVVVFACLVFPWLVG
jgi:hypothetical protein